ncbi:hypothetical protein [Nocardiopsis sp. CC223A]|uniref:hypothetical protein n=1 Tax=Nocardiopsis sp. CC223A TaxID=3044051 RepID=UPI00278C4ABD|nr:hypothetical protein [Nocardiopsis sp. CC223A]
MDVTLADGRTISLTRGMADALRGAAPLPDAPHVWSPVYPGAPDDAALIELGLAERTHQGLLGLTPLGHEVRDRLLSPAAADTARIILDPQLPDDRRRALSAALAGRDTPPERPVGRAATALRMSYAGLLAYAAGAIVLRLPPVWSIPLVLCTAALVGVLSNRRERELGRPDPRRVLESLADHYVRPDRVEGKYRTLLERARRAVDTVLDSGPHREGLLLDTVRNRVVLAETEWAIARGLARLSDEAARADRTPVTGERSRAAAERARAALAEERGRLQRRIELLEEYAALVRAFEAERADAASAREFDAIADRVIESGAAHDLHDESLASLVRAQELALELSDLTAEGGPWN